MNTQRFHLNRTNKQVLFCLGLCLVSYRLPATTDPDPQYNTTNPSYNNYIDVTAPPFNATGNDTTDDTAAINAAINALGSEGGRLFFPKGTYYVSGAGTLTPSGAYVLINLSSKRNVTLMGTGTSSRIRTPQGTGSYATSDPCLIGISGSTNCEVRDLRVTGANKAYPGFDTRAGSAIFIYNSVRVRVHNVFIEDAQVGIANFNSSWCKFTENHITGNIAQSGIETHNDGNGNSDHNIVSGNTLDGGEDSTIGMGIRICSRFTTISFNTIRNCSFEPMPIEGGTNEYLTIVGNTIENKLNVKFPRKSGQGAEKPRKKTNHVHDNENESTDLRS